MPRIAAALLSGLLFGLGLVIAQMTDPAKVLGFLDLAGDWDPSLAFVMGGAIPVAALGFRLSRRWRAPLCAPGFAAPTKTAIDSRLAAGAALFGAGWGLVGYCPGPALASLSFGGLASAVFVAAMLVGMAGFRLFGNPAPRPQPGGVTGQA